MTGGKWIIVLGVFFLVVILLTLSTFSLMLIFWAFFAGVSAAVFILKPGYELPNFWPSKSSSTIKQDRKVSHLCSVCGLENCQRERTGVALETSQPWIGIELNERVDKALSEFLELLLQTYVWNWYRNLSEDETFVDELKVALRHCLAVLYRRINKVDLSEVIIGKLLHVGLLHLHVCMSAIRADCNTEDEILMWFGPKIHRALTDRRSELKYIRSLCNGLFPFICPSSLIESSTAKAFLRELLSSNVILYGIDVIDDPDKINRLLLIFFDETPPREPDEPPSKMVSFLEQFASRNLDLSESKLLIDLPKIMDNHQFQHTLFGFMNFLKNVGAVHLLQFCLTVNDFNRRYLSQDQDESQQVALQQEAKEIFNSYCCPDSPNFIHFDQDVIDELRVVAEEQPCAFNGVRTSAPLFRAYDHVYDLLERIYCPLFYQSDLYYETICGKRRRPMKHNKSAKLLSSIDKNGAGRSSFRRSKELKESSSSSNFSNGVDLEQDENLIDGDEKTCQLLIEDEIASAQMINCDLSTWRVEIPGIEMLRKDDPATRNLVQRTDSMERVYIYRINVKRVDLDQDSVRPENWTVYRRYAEFYVLENKLAEFHGNLGIVSLPPKKILGKLSYAFLESKMADFEKFLKALVSKSRLRHSELLFDFLCYERGNASSNFDSKFLPDVKLGRIFRRMPTKLLKEKGQHLSVFLQSFVQSCEPPKPKPGKYEPITDNPEVQMDHKLHHELYPEGDWVLDSFQDATAGEKVKATPFFSGVCDYLIFIGVEVFKASPLLHHVMVGLKKLFKPTLEPFVHRYLRAKIDTYRQEHHVVDVIHLFRDMLFYPDNKTRTEEEKTRRRDETYRAWEKFVPELFSYLVGTERHSSGCKIMFDILQHPKLNKQLGYVLLDTFLLELFPELDSNQ